MNYSNTPNRVIENVFTQDEINQIWQAMSNNSGGAFVKVHSQANTFIQLPDSIVEKVTNYAKEITGSQTLVLTEYCHARYANVTSNCGLYHYRPSLFPHYDETFPEPRFTFDYQLNANVDWPIIAEPDIELTLKNNQAATFSGTHQIHWRKPQEFNDNEFVEMVFFHFSDPALPPKTEEENKAIRDRAAKYKAEFLQNGGFTNEDIG